MRRQQKWVLGVAAARSTQGSGEQSPGHSSLRYLSREGKNRSPRQKNWLDEWQEVLLSHLILPCGPTEQQWEI
jgi:hypothetical protein